MPRTRPARPPAAPTPPARPAATVADLLERLGGVPADRVWADPPPGTATEADVVRWLEAADKRLVELVDGTLVEKAMSAIASYVAGALLELLRAHVRAHGRTGMVLGADGTLRLMPGLLRAPDVSYTRWDKVPGRVVPAAPVPDLVPDLAVEVLSPSNTAGEMDRKVGEYFRAGVSAAWLVDPYRRAVRVYTAADACADLSAAAELSGDPLLPAFRVAVADLFADLPPAPPKPARRGKKKPG